MRKQDFIEIFFTSLPLFCYGPNSWASSSPSHNTTGLCWPLSMKHSFLLHIILLLRKHFFYSIILHFFPIDFVIVVSPLPLHRKNILTYFFLFNKLPKKECWSPDDVWTKHFSPCCSEFIGLIISAARERPPVGVNQWASLWTGSQPLIFRSIWIK